MWTDPQHHTGCTVILPPAGTVGGIAVRGGAPGTREAAILGPATPNEACHSAGETRVMVPTLTAIKVMLYQGMREQAIGKAELARRLGWHLPQVDRVLDVRHRSRLDRMDAALGAIGCRLEVRAMDDASMAVLSASTSASLPKAVGIKDHGN